MPINIGTQLGSHEVTALLGKGGMGEVYRARDTKLKREVAIKLLPEHMSHDADRLARFQREAEVLASLNHPNIAHVYGLEQSGQTQFIVMELVEGLTLQERLKSGAMPLNEALAVAIQVAEALESAHERNIIHRDLKPANIKLTPDGKVKVLDFGLAKAMEAAPESPALSNSPTLSMAATQAGMILGTAAYMSPEQAKGLQADARSDVFSFGCVLYELLTGRQAFQFDTTTEILAAILMREPDMSALPVNLNPRLKDALRRCLEKNPKRRWQAVGDLRAELEAIAAAAPVVPAEPELHEKRRLPLWRRAIPIAVSAVLFSVIAGIAGWSLRKPAAESVIKFPLVLPDGQQMLTATASHPITISPDGKWLVYLANNQIFLRSMSEMEARPIMGKPGTDTTRSIAEPFFSPDSKWVGFYSREDGALEKIAITGGAAVILCKTDSVSGVWWEGDQIYFARLRDKGIMRLSENGGEPEEIVPRSKAGEAYHGPQPVDGGRSLLFTVATEQGDDRWDRGDIVLQSLKTGQRKVLVHGGSDAHYLPTGHLVYALGGTLFVVPLDLKKGEVRGGPVPVLQGVMRALALNTAAAHYAFSTNGTLAYVPGSGAAGASQRTLALVERNSGKVRPLPLPPQNYLYPRFSPDGNQLAFSTEDGRDTVIWIYDLKSQSPPRRLTFEGRNSYPIWTRDGRSITFQSIRDGDRGIFQQPADGSGKAERLTPAEQSSPPIPEAWTPDGRTLLFSIGGTGVSSRAIMMLSLEDTKVKGLVTNPPSGFRQANSSLSPDGRWVAYNSNDTLRGNSGFRVFVEPFPPTGAKYEVPDGSSAPLWSPDGKQLFYGSGGVGGNRIVSVDVKATPGFSFGTPVPVAIEGLVPTSATSREYDISPDGKQFVAVLEASTGQGVKQPNPQINLVLNWFEELKQRVPVE
jgi:serine/threonine-protein kinase